MVADVSSKESVLKSFLVHIKDHPLCYDKGHPDFQNQEKTAQTWSLIGIKLQESYSIDILTDVGLYPSTPEKLRAKYSYLKYAWSSSQKKGKSKSGSAGGKKIKIQGILLPEIF